jgi:lactoylglutathione lyase
MAAAENIKGENRLRTDPERGIMQADQNRREPMFAFNHFNFNVTDLERSIAFYHDALGLKPVRRKEAADGSFIRHRNVLFEEDEYVINIAGVDLGECEFHLALAVEDMEKAHALHEKLGCICYENPAMGIYFISDPDGYWIEIIPTK